RFGAPRRVGRAAARRSGRSGHLAHGDRAGQRGPPARPVPVDERRRSGAVVPGRPVSVFSVAIPAYNVETVIGEQLASLAAQDFRGEWEVLVSDNGSTDATVARVLEWCGRLPGLRLVDASQRRGRSPARNIGAAE